MRRIPRPIKRRVRRAYRRHYRRRFDPTWYQHTMGGQSGWGKMGRLQFDFLREHGLQPHHYLLDVGCGPLRAGVHLIRYLESGHYFGVERRAHVLEAGKEEELPRQGLTEKRPVLTVMKDFGFERLGQTFDYALAQSVFTHLSANHILRCLANMEQALVPGGKFFATIYVNDRGKLHLDPIEQRPGIVTLMDKNPYHYDLSIFDWLCEGTTLTPEYIGDWGSPRNQKMLAFAKSETG